MKTDFSNYISFSLIFITMLLISTGCNTRNTTSGGGFIVEMRQNVTTNNPIVFSEEITHIEYIPLEFSPDGASMLAEAMDLAVTDDFIFVYSMKQGGVFQFSRADGKFIRRFAPTGNGPGETQLILNIYADEANKDIYIVQSHNTLKYNFEGEYISTQEQTRPISLQYPIGEDRIAQLGAELVPFNTPELIDMGVFTRDGEIVKIKDNFARPDVVPQDNSCIKDVRRAFSDKSILYFIDLNDTIFRLSSDDIQPAFVLNRQNSREYLEGSMTPRGETMLPNDFWVYDFFETPGALYVRALYNENEKMHLFAFDKATRTTTAEISKINPSDIFGLDWWMQGIGIQIGDGKIPLWATKTYPEKNILVQYMPAPELFYLKEEGFIDQIPVEIGDIEEDGNPVVIIYHIN